MPRPYIPAPGGGGPSQRAFHRAIAGFELVLSAPPDISSIDVGALPTRRQAAHLHCRWHKGQSWVGGRGAPGWSLI